jgi:homoserine acetyltransferase
MREVVRRHPGDDEAAVLYAEAEMLLRPWNYWTPAKTLHRGMDAAVTQLERVRTRNADHPGACHFYIHAVEAVEPQRAVPCAERLAALMPGAGHLVHMPAHIYIRVGRYEDAIRANEHAVHADGSYIRDWAPTAGIYTAGYYPHNFDFLAFAAAMAGRESQALAAADTLGQLAAQNGLGAPGMAFLEHHATRGLQMRLRFERWHEVLAAPAFGEPLLHARAMWHYARGRALVALTRIPAAERELAALRSLRADPRLSGLRLEFNESPAILAVAERVLAGVIEGAHGRDAAAIALLREAVLLEDALNYGEPPDWTIPVRQDLGAALLVVRDGPGAEATFREDLARFPRNRYSERGLARTLRLQQNTASLRSADLGSCPTASGVPVLDCRLTYRTFGRLNAAKDNAVLIPTWHGGRSEHLTFLLGADRWVDTTRYYAILVDKLGNGSSTSPSNSVRQPGREFPTVTFGDLVDAQRRLVVEHLGIPRLHAVLGWSMGGMQSLAWGLRHPTNVARVVSVAGTPRMATSEMFTVRSMRSLLDLAAETRMPRATLALRLAELWHSIATTPGHENKLPRDSMDAMLLAEAEGDWVPLDLDDHRVQLDAVAAFDGFRDLAEARRVGATLPRTLLLFVEEDRVTTPEMFRAFAPAAGADAIALSSPCGHLMPVCETAQIGVHVREYLARP